MTSEGWAITIVAVGVAVLGTLYFVGRRDQRRREASADAAATAITSSSLQVTPEAQAQAGDVTQDPALQNLSPRARQAAAEIVAIR